MKHNSKIKPYGIGSLSLIEGRLCEMVGLIRLAAGKWSPLSLLSLLYLPACLACKLPPHLHSSHPPVPLRLPEGPLPFSDQPAKCEIGGIVVTLDPVIPCKSLALTGRYLQMCSSEQRYVANSLQYASVTE